MRSGGLVRVPHRQGSQQSPEGGDEPPEAYGRASVSNPRPLAPRWLLLGRFGLVVALGPGRRPGAGPRRQDRVTRACLPEFPEFWASWRSRSPTGAPRRSFSRRSLSIVSAWAATNASNSATRAP